MSWSVNMSGKSDVLVARAAKEFEGIRYLKEPENTVKNAVAALVDQALRAQIPACAVKIACSGSMSVQGATGDSPDRVTNTLKVDVEPIYGFVFE